jgi:hypothetical protein
MARVHPFLAVALRLVAHGRCVFLLTVGIMTRMVSRGQDGE